MKSLIFHFGKYCLLIARSFSPPEKLSEYWKEITREMVSIGYGSLFLSIFTSIFLGAVTIVQVAFQLTNEFVSKTTLAVVVRDSAILELAPTMTSLVLAGKIGSNISSQIGTMRVTEQIDALEVMGINTNSYIVLPKIIAGVTMIPILVIISAITCIFGGYIAGSISGAIGADTFIQGLTTHIDNKIIVVCIIKSIVYGFLITSIPSYYGFYVEGGAREVGKAGTQSAAVSCITILVADYLIAQALL
ncbi:MAG: MlaE family ABC transporter permease [Solitalea-like symbiont of Tyrophagus putrescentiae]